RRSDAAKRLKDLGEQAEGALEAALMAKPSEEQRRRLAALIASSRVVRAPELLRSVRAVEALERIGGAEARRALDALAQCGPESGLTKEAKASLSRVEKKRLEK